MAEQQLPEESNPPRAASGGQAASFAHERQVQSQGYQRIAGIDEAGRGALAGPVVAAAVILPLDNVIPHLTDSKLLRPSQREELCDQICQQGVAWAVGVVSNDVIDERNILQATYIAMRTALDRLDPPADFALIDGRPVKGIELPHKTLIDGDRLCCSIAAASIVAKVTRDAIMTELAERFPGYGFEQHKGYGTRAHRQALREQGPCAVHRRSFEPVKAAAQLLLDIQGEP